MMGTQRSLLSAWALALAVVAAFLGQVSACVASAPAQPVTVVAVQMRVDLADYESPQAFKDTVNEYMRKAVGAPGDGPRLVAFPEDVGIGLLVIDDYPVVKDCASWGEAATLLIDRYQPQVGDLMAQYGCSPMHALLLLKGERINEVYVDTFSEAAKEHHVTLVAGSAPLPGPEGAVYNTSLIFGPTGELLGAQRKVNLIDLEGPRGLDLTPSSLDAIQATDTPVGRIGVAICNDMFFSEVVEKLVSGGSQILVQPSLNPREWDAWQQEDWKRGIWTAVKTHPTVVAGVNPMMVGSLFEIDVEGISSVTGGPFEPPNDGYLAQACSAGQADIVAAEVPVSGR